MTHKVNIGGNVVGSVVGSGDTVNARDINNQGEMSQEGAPTPTVGIITALPHESAAVRAILGDPPRIDVSGSGGGRTYWMGEIPPPRKSVHCVVIAQAGMGNNIASIRASLLLSCFPSVQSIIMCGIAGGIPHPAKADDHVRLGDIVVSNIKGVVQYDFIKRTIKKKKTDVPEEVRAAPHRPSAELLDAVQALVADEHFGKRPWERWLAEGLDRLKWARPDAGTDVLAGDVGPVPHPSDPKRREGQPRVFLGPIASANTLLKDSAKRDALRNQFSAKAVEMEGSGITDATWTHGIGYLVVRGICDYCDAHKNDTWQNYAAMAAAAYVRALLESMPGTVPVPPSLTPGATISAPSGGVLTDDATIIVNQAFKALSDLIQSAEIAVEVRVYQEDFKRTYEKIEILSTYKQLHDLLHDLQLRSYNFIAEQVRIAITGEGYLDWGSLENPAEIDLADLITQLQKVVDRRVLQPFETSWIHGLVKGYEELHEAIALMPSGSFRLAYGWPGSCESNRRDSLARRIAQQSIYSCPSSSKLCRISTSA